MWAHWLIGSYIHTYQDKVHIAILTGAKKTNKYNRQFSEILI